MPARVPLSLCASCGEVTPTTSAPGFESRLECFLGHIGEELPRSDLRRKFALYTLGLFSEAERKSIEPLAAQTRPEAPDAARLAMLHFVANAPWDDRAVRRALAWALWGATARSPLRGTILDDTGLLKQGRHSVGVQCQYTGSAGSHRADATSAPPRGRTLRAARHAA